MRSIKSSRLFDIRVPLDESGRSILFAKLMRAIAPPVTVAIGVIVLRWSPPAQTSWYPRCPVYETLHLKCPGCGATRAIAALLRGDFNGAMHLNALVVLLSPVVAVYSMLWYYRVLRGETMVWPEVPTAALYIGLAMAALFAVVRNLPV